MRSLLCIFFFFNDTATTEIYTLSLHDALPISHLVDKHFQPVKLIDVIGTVDLMFERHVIAKARAASTDHRHTESRRDGGLLGHNLFYLAGSAWRKVNHLSSLSSLMAN